MLDNKFKNNQFDTVKKYVPWEVWWRQVWHGFSFRQFRQGSTNHLRWHCGQKSKFCWMVSFAFGFWSYGLVLARFFSKITNMVFYPTLPKKISRVFKISCDRHQRDRSVCRIQAYTWSESTWAKMTMCLPENFFSNSRTTFCWIFCHDLSCGNGTKMAIALRPDPTSNSRAF